MKEIRHEGIIDSIGSDGHVRVRITQMSACAGCRVAAHCNASEQKIKTVDVFAGAVPALRGGRPYRVGDSVVVAASGAVAWRALLLGFGLPLVLLLAVLAVMLAASCSEGMSALVSLAVLLPYYLALWLCRKGIAGSISFKIVE